MKPNPQDNLPAAGRSWTRKLATPLLALAALAGLATSLQAQTPSLVFSNKWSLAPGSRWDLDTGNLTRGVAINKVTGNVLICSRVSSNHVSVVSGVDGSDTGVVFNCTNTVVTGGTFGLNLVRVADDGAIYAGNLATSAHTYKLYRWSSEADAAVNPPTVAYDDSVSSLLSAARYGDQMDIRGAGTNTQIIVSGSSANAFAVLTTTDGTNFTAFEYTPVPGGAGEYGFGLTFDRTNNVVYGKGSGSSVILHYTSYNPAGPATATALITNSTVPSLNLVGIKAGSSNGVNFLVGVRTANATSPHLFNAYTVNGSNAVISLVASLANPSTVANGNAVATSDIGAGMAVACDVNNGIMAAAISFVTNLPPNIITPPADQTNVLAGGYVTFSVSAGGTVPLKYQWYYTDTGNTTTNKITWVVSTNATVSFTNLSLTNSGFYSVVVTNTSGSVTSSLASLVVVPSTLTTAVVPIWTKSVGDLYFISANNTERGMAYNPVNGHLIVVSRTPTNGVYVLDAATGSLIRTLDMSAIGTEGIFPINMVGVGDDGAVYVANLDTAGTQYKIYRWADDAAATVATVAYGPADPGAGRIGDTFAVRGAGLNTELLASSRNGTQVILFNTTDGLNFSPNTIDVVTQPTQFAGLGLAWGANLTNDGYVTESFWSKSSGFQFRHIGFDLAQGTNGLLQTFAAGQQTDVILGVDPINNLIASIVPNTSGGTGPRAIPDHLDLYNINEVLADTNGVTEPNLCDQDFFQTDNINANGTGAVAFDVAGGRVFALDSNNGLFAGKVVARLFDATSGSNLILNWTGPSKLLEATVVTGPWTTNVPATSPHTNALTGTKYFRLQR